MNFKTVPTVHATASCGHLWLNDAERVLAEESSAARIRSRSGNGLDFYPRGLHAVTDSEEERESEEDADEEHCSRNASAHSNQIGTITDSDEEQEHSNRDADSSHGLLGIISFSDEMEANIVERHDDALTNLLQVLNNRIDGARLLVTDTLVRDDQYLEERSMETTKQGLGRLHRRKHGLGANVVEANESECKDKTNCLTRSDGTTTDIHDRSCSEKDGGCIGRVGVQGKQFVQPDQGQTLNMAKIREKFNGPDTESLLHSLLKGDSSVEEMLIAQKPFFGSDSPRNRSHSPDKAASRTEKNGRLEHSSTMASQPASRQRVGTGKSANSTAVWAKNILSSFLWSAFRVRLSSCKRLTQMNAPPGLSAAMSDAVVEPVENGPAKRGDVEDGKRPSLPTWLKRQIETQRRAGVGQRQAPVGVASVMDQALKISNALLQLRYSDFFSSSLHLEELRRQLEHIDGEIRKEDDTWREIARELHKRHSPTLDAAGHPILLQGRARRFTKKDRRNFTSTGNLMAKARDIHISNARARRRVLAAIQQSVLAEAASRVEAFVDDFSLRIQRRSNIVSLSSAPVELCDLERALHQNPDYIIQWQVMASLPKSLTEATVRKLQAYERSMLFVALKAVVEAAQRRTYWMMRLMHGLEFRVVGRWYALTVVERRTRADTKAFQERVTFQRLVELFDGWCAHYEGEKTRMQAELLRMEEQVAQLQNISESWIEYELDDTLGRLEFVGHVVLVAGDLRPHGQGVMLWSDGARYVGEWAQGKTSGVGHEWYEDGSNYIGQFNNDMRHGMGVFTTSAGDKYTGNWIAGVRHGLGICVQTIETRQTAGSSNGEGHLRVSTDAGSNAGEGDLPRGHVSVRKSRLSVFGEFVAGELEVRLQDAAQEKVLIEQVGQVVEVTNQIVEMSQTFASEIRLRFDCYDGDAKERRTEASPALPSLLQNSCAPMPSSRTRGSPPSMSASPSRADDGQGCRAEADCDKLERERAQKESTKHTEDDDLGQDLGRQSTSEAHFNSLESESFQVQVEVWRAENLPKMDTLSFFGSGSADPYVVLQSGGVVHRSTTKKNTLNPNWAGESFTFNATSTSVPTSSGAASGNGMGHIQLTLYDWDRFSKDEVIGEARLSLADLIHTESTTIALNVTAPGTGDMVFGTNKKPATLVVSVTSKLLSSRLTTPNDHLHVTPPSSPQHVETEGAGSQVHLYEEPELVGRHKEAEEFKGNIELLMTPTTTCANVVNSCEDQVAEAQSQPRDANRTEGESESGFSIKGHIRAEEHLESVSKLQAYVRARIIAMDRLSLEHRTCASIALQRALRCRNARRKRLQLVQHENDCTAADTQLQQAAQRWLGTAVGVILRNWNDLASLQAKEDHNNVMSMETQREIQILSSAMLDWRDAACLHNCVLKLQAHLRRHTCQRKWTSMAVWRHSCVALQCAWRGRHARVRVLQAIVLLYREEIEQHQTPRVRRYAALLGFWRQRAREEATEKERQTRKQAELQEANARQNEEQDKLMQMAEEEREKKAWLAFWSKASGSKLNSRARGNGLRGGALPGVSSTSKILAGAGRGGSGRRMSREPLGRCDAEICLGEATAETRHTNTRHKIMDQTGRACHLSSSMLSAERGKGEKSVASRQQVKTRVEYASTAKRYFVLRSSSNREESEDCVDVDEAQATRLPRLSAQARQGLSSEWEQRDKWDKEWKGEMARERARERIKARRRANVSCDYVRRTSPLENYVDVKVPAVSGADGGRRSQDDWHAQCEEAEFEQGHSIGWNRRNGIAESYLREMDVSSVQDDATASYAQRSPEKEMQCPAHSSMDDGKEAAWQHGYHRDFSGSNASCRSWSWSVERQIQLEAKVEEQKMRASEARRLQKLRSIEYTDMLRRQKATRGTYVPHKALQAAIGDGGGKVTGAGRHTSLPLIVGKSSAASEQRSLGDLNLKKAAGGIAQDKAVACTKGNQHGDGTHVVLPDVPPAKHHTGKRTSHGQAVCIPRRQNHPNLAAKESRGVGRPDVRNVNCKVACEQNIADTAVQWGMQGEDMEDVIMLGGESGAEKSQFSHCQNAAEPPRPGGPDDKDEEEHGLFERISETTSVDLGRSRIAAVNAAAAAATAASAAAAAASAAANAAIAAVR